MKYYKIIFIQVLILVFTVPLSFASELKFGFVQSPQKNERGININLEYLLEELKDYRSLTPFIGLNKNLQGYTSSVYMGLVWKKTLKDFFFTEVSLGFALHDGPIKRKENLKVRGRIFGSRLLFRESLSFGYSFNNSSIALFIDHISNANIAPPNHGLTNIGIRYGTGL